MKTRRRRRGVEWRGMAMTGDTAMMASGSASSTSPLRSVLFYTM